MATKRKRKTSTKAVTAPTAHENAPLVRFKLAQGVTLLDANGEPLRGLVELTEAECERLSKLGHGSYE